MQRIRVTEVISGGKVKRVANSKDELFAYLKVKKLMKKLGVKL